MNGELNSYCARLRVGPRYVEVVSAPPASSVLVVGYRACFATAPKPGTPVAAFPAITPATTTTDAAPPMALVSIERATQIIRDRESYWEEGYFGIFGDSGVHWCLIPVDPTVDSRFVIAEGWWAAGGYQAVLTRSVIANAPTAPTVVAVHNAHPSTGRKKW
ncbi:hypothetical protein [Nocardia sp. NPDC059228]|uniref:hypothetical protein n=1 Tax=Nocardia sp. NPDC059228 TaxID=3346777 RepID=UPI003692B747